MWLPDRPVAELGVEGRHAGDRGRRDVGQLADPLQSLLGQVAVVLLDRLENRNHRLRRTADVGRRSDRRR